MGKIYLLTGAIQSGKTSLCLEIAAASREVSVNLGGLISPAVFQAGEKIAIDLVDLKSGERRSLADGRGGKRAGIETKRWAFHPEIVAWGNQVLEKAIPCDLLLIDELGPLEFKRGEGWTTSFKIVDSGQFRAALLVIRPSLLEEALSRWDVEEVINLDDPDQDLRTGKKIIAHLFEG